MQAQIFARLTERLASAGAGCVAVTSIAGHFCRNEFEALSPLPVVDMIDAVGRAVTARLVRRIGILGTRTVMESRFYGGVTTATVLLPVGTDLEDVHDAYVTMATAGAVTDVQRTIFHGPRTGGSFRVFAQKKSPLETPSSSINRRRNP
jgi:aspartate racemase